MREIGHFIAGEAKGFGTTRFGEVLEGARFHTETKTVTQRRPHGAGAGESAFIIPTIG